MVKTDQSIVIKDLSNLKATDFLGWGEVFKDIEYALPTGNVSHRTKYI